MKQCEVCGNEYDHLLEIKQNGISYWFDCFECAVHKLAPKCAQCGVKILGHGVQVEEQLLCCAHCARLLGHNEIVDHSEKTIGI